MKLKSIGQLRLILLLGSYNSPVKKYELSKRTGMTYSYTCDLLDSLRKQNMVIFVNKGRCVFVSMTPILKKYITSPISSMVFETK